MRNYIIISKEQAEAVRGRHGKYSALEPVEFPDGKFAIPERCIDDPEFADIKVILQKYQKEEIVQDIIDLEAEKSIAVGKDKYYLSREYWVVKSLKDSSLILAADSNLTEMKDTFLVRRDIATSVDSEKLVGDKLSFTRGFELLTNQNVSYAKAAYEMATIKTKGFFGRLWDKIKNWFIKLFKNKRVSCAE